MSNKIYYISFISPSCIVAPPPPPPLPPLPTTVISSPPPPPPPFPQTSVSGVPPPPPPPTTGNSSPIRIPKYRSAFRLKKIHWEKISNAENTVWSKMKHDHTELMLNESGIFKEIDKQFATNISKVQKNVVSEKSSIDNRVLDEKRAQNISIRIHNI